MIYSLFSFFKKITYNPLFLIGTLINCFIAFLLVDLTVFFIRELVLLIMVSFFTFFEEELKIVRDDLEKVNKVLVQIHWIFKYEAIIYILLVPVTIVCGFEFSGVFRVLYLLAGCYGFFCFCFCIIRLYLILKTPELRVLYKRSQHKLPKNMKFVSTWAIPFLKVCTECVKFGTVFSAFTVSTCWAVPKAIYGPQHRSIVMNSIGSCFTGLKSRNDVLYGAAVHYIDDYPEAKSVITGPDGMTVNPRKFLEHIKANNLDPTLYGITGDDLKSLKDKDE